MRIHLLSDLHLEHGSYQPASVQADVVVLAGDVWTPSKGSPARMVEWAAAHYPDVPVVLVAGNHDLWKGSLERNREKFARAAAGTDVHFCERNEVLLGGVRFLGVTLWTDYALFGDPGPTMLECLQRMNDHRYVRVGSRYRRAMPRDFAADHRASVRWLEERLADPEAGDMPTVVVTHHAPSRSSLPPAMAGDVVSAAYASNLEGLIERGRPIAWLHGHTHHPVDYGLGDTRVVSNPRGYGGDPCPGFEPEMVVEVPPGAPPSSM